MVKCDIEVFWLRRIRSATNTYRVKYNRRQTDT